MSGAEIAALIASVWAGASAIEVCAAALGVTYVVLVIGQYRACWLAALASTALYLYVCYAQALYMQAALQAYYVVVALYGWRVWRAAPGRAPLPVSRAAWHLQLAGLAGVLAASAASASWLARETASTQPLLDSLTTWASVFATWLVARKKLDNWAWWLATDVLIAVLFWRQRLYPSMMLYVLYLVLIPIGWRSWSADLKRQRAVSAGRI